MRIKTTFVITGLPIGGAEIMLFKVLQQLSPAYMPHVISLTNMGEVGRNIRALGIPVEALGMRPGGDPLAFIRLVRRLRTIKPDVVHTWMYHADLLGGLAAKLAGVKAIAWCIRNSDLDPTKTKLGTRVVVWVCARLSPWLPARIVSCSEAARRIHGTLGYASSKMIVIPNGFNLAHFVPDRQARESVRRELGLASETPLVGLIGRLDPQKNHAGFLQAAGLVHRRLPQVHFLLAGKGVDPDDDHLRREIQDAGINHVVHLLGFRTDIPRLMAALDVLASSSSYGEAFPNVLGEAMACGVPCAVTDVGDSAQIIGDTGRVVRPRDMKALAISIEELLNLPAADRAAVAKRARTRVEENFEISKVAQRYEALYDELTRRLSDDPDFNPDDQHTLPTSAAKKLVEEGRFTKRPLSWTAKYRRYHLKIPRVGSRVDEDASSARARAEAEKEYAALMSLSVLSGSIVKPLGLIEDIACLVTPIREGRELRDILMSRPTSVAAESALKQSVKLLAEMHRNFRRRGRPQLREIDYMRREPDLAWPTLVPERKTIVAEGFEVRNLILSPDTEHVSFFDPHDLYVGYPEDDFSRFVVSLLMVNWGKGLKCKTWTGFSLDTLMAMYEEHTDTSLHSATLKCCFRMNVRMRDRNASVSIEKMTSAVRPLARLYKEVYFRQIGSWGAVNGL